MDSVIEIIPTYVPRNVEDLAEGALKIRAYASSIHVDVDDGIFAPHRTWPYVKEGVFEPFDLASLSGLNVEVHLMVEEPYEIGRAFARAGVTRIIGHIEGFSDKREVFAALHAWRDAGASEVGLGILLTTSFEVIAPLVEECDVVHLMSIATIGTQGIPYNDSAPARIKEFHTRFPDTVISVDGGVSEKNVADLVRSGARRFGVGSAIMKSDNPKAAYEHIKSVAERAVQ